MGNNHTEMSLIKFSDNAQEELLGLERDLRLGRLAELISTNKVDLPQDVRDDLTTLTYNLIDMFGMQVPVVGDNLAEDLGRAARDYQLSRVLRERALFRVHAALNKTVKVVDMQTGELEYMPAFMQQINPDTGVPFTTREDFIRWYCTEAHMNRATVFMRLATIKKLGSLGFSLEEAYTTIIARPFAIRETLKELAKWDNGELVSVPLPVAERMAEKMLPEKAAEVASLSAMVKQDLDIPAREEARIKLNELVKPMLADTVREVAAHPSIRDAMDMVRFDLSAKPEIRYFWNEGDDTLDIEFAEQDADGLYSPAVRYRFFCDKEIPEALRDDLVRRLPIRNREIRK